MRFPIILLLAAVTFASSLAGAETNLLARVRRIVFLGDSITYGGQFVDDVEAFLVSRFPEQRFEVLNLGLPSETVSGLSEPGHADGQFPRPDLHERLGRVLEQTQPNLVIACYGMNDGIYYPPGGDRLQKFQEGTKRLHERVTATGAKILHVTPPVFDPVPIKSRTLPAGLKEYRSPYVGYNEVLDRYSEWLLGQRAQGWLVVDAHGPMNRFLAERREKEPGFRLAGDGVHPDSTGHWLIARAILPALGAPSEASQLESVQAMLASHPHGDELLQLIQQRQRLLKDAWLTQTGHQRPGMNKGLTLAEAQKQAAELETKIRAIAAPFPGKRSSWNGFDRFAFPVAGLTVSVIAPHAALPGRLWAWKGEFLDALSWNAVGWGVLGQPQRVE